MFKFLRKHRTVLLITMAACFIGLLFFGVGGSSFSSSRYEIIARINGKKITQIQFDRLYNRILRQRSDASPEDRQKFVAEAFNELVRQEVFYQEAKKYGIRVTDQELMLSLASIPAFQNEGRFDPRVYVQVVTQSFGLPVKEFEEVRKKDMAGSKLNQLVASAVRISEQDLHAAIQRRLTIETDPETKKELQDNPEKLRNLIRNEEINRVYSDWLNQMNANLKVDPSDKFKKRLSGQS